MTVENSDVFNFANVLLPVPVEGNFSYRVPRSMAEEIQIGSRVVVQFGRKRVLTGIVGQLHNTKPSGTGELKTIIAVLDPKPLVNHKQLAFFSWISEYYLSTIGHVIKAAIPSGLKLSSESKIQLNPSFSHDVELSLDEQEILLELETKADLTYAMVSAIINKKNIHPVIRSLIKKEAIILFEELRDRYKPKLEKRIRLLETNSDSLGQWIENLEKKEGQLNVLLKYLSVVPVLNDPLANEKGISQKQLLSGDISSSSLKTLIKNGLFEKVEFVVPRLEDVNIQDLRSASDIVLSPAQEQAKTEIMESFATKNTTLLHGVTGSGKTEIFIQLIQENLDNGSQVLYLLPEIALSTQMIQRLRLYFGDRVGIYHSRFSDNERVEIWKGVLEGKYEFVVGVRSSIFLPFDRLGLIIIDEEHEFSYKQFEPAPRYQARDAALVLAQIHSAKTLLGTATPAIETYWNCLEGKYGLVTLKDRFGDAILPEITLFDAKPDVRNKALRGEFTPTVLQLITETIEQKKQAIVFQNRRGYAPYVNCNDCGAIPKCVNCAVSLTYHLFSNELKCHYCGHRQSLPNNCNECHSTHIETMSFGTQKLEEDLQQLLPSARIIRMDFDSTRSKKSYEEIIDKIQNKEVDIIVGTQMISKGFDFGDIDLVAILGADQIVHFPDFRAHEKAFSLLTQVAGRTGRRSTKGKVIVQSSQPENFVLQSMQQYDYLALYEKEIEDRERYLYPPFVRLVKLVVKDYNNQKAMNMAWELRRHLLLKFSSNTITGPNPALIFRLRNQFQFELIIRIHRKKTNLKGWKNQIRKSVSEVLKQQQPKTTRIVIDVDPF